LPSISIDTFFACSLMVSVVLISTALCAGTLNANMSGLQDLNEDRYLRAISEYLVSSCGVPADWGSNMTSVPETFGLAKEDSLRPNELDIDKVSRLNGENIFAIKYLDILAAAQLKDVALGISISQLLNISVSLILNSTSGNLTTYTFKVFVSQDGAPVAASVHYYLVAEGFLSDNYSSTATDGLGNVDVEIPKASNGTASLVVFARALQDPRMTAFDVYSFGHLSAGPPPNNTFLKLSPLDYTLFLGPNYSGLVLENCYAFSYGYESNLTSNSNTTYAIPTIVDNGPTVLVVSGLNDSTFFIESTTYPEIPLETGSTFQNSECHAFSYIVTIKETLYKLTIRFGGVNQ
jgi:hypothetical protein